MWIWNDIVRGRHLALKSVRECPPESMLHLASIHAKIADAAVGQGVRHIVKSQLSMSNSLRRTVLGKLTVLTMEEVSVVYQYNKLNIYKEDPTNSLKIVGMFEKTMALLDKKADYIENDEEAATVYLLRAEWLALWGEFERKFSPTAPPNRMESAMEGYRQALAQLEVVGDPRRTGAGYGKFCGYCDTLLMRDDIDQDSKQQLAITTLDAIARGLILSDSFCRDKILRFVHLAGEYPGAMDSLSISITAAPAWIFLKYIAQLMGCLDRPEGPVSAGILEYAASKYPTALYYPWKVTSECLGTVGKKLATNIRTIVHNDTLDAFVEALYGLTHPELRWSDGYKEIHSFFEEQRGDLAREAYCNIKEFTLNQNWSNVGNKIGLYNSSFAKKYEREFDKLFGSQGERLTSNNLKVLKEKVDAMKSTMKYNEGKTELNLFSQWLTDVNVSTLQIEIPGQYAMDINKEPTVDRHAKIVSVHPLLLVMGSVRKPKRIIFIGSDGNEYAFLVKGGEDLRNDERIENLFILMNSLCSSIKLQARTYSVIPMTSKVGLLEWVQNTIPLKKIIEIELIKDQKFCALNSKAFQTNNSNIDINLALLSASIDRSNWIKDQQVETPKCYYNMIREVAKNDPSKIWNKISSKIPDNFLRKFILRKSSSAEIFLTLRVEYAKSLAVSSIFGYVLGIGDRHLDNLLMDEYDGSIIQIDFGICFGMGASVLPVPELIPFRLTAQLRGMLQPLDGAGLLRHYMIMALSKLRTEHGIAIMSNALEVYINDPVLDWLKKGKQNKNLILENRDNMSWEPRRRILNAILKLKGSHPIEILLSDLSENNFLKKENIISSLTTILNDDISKGNQIHEETLLDVSAQVDILIKLATCPKVLILQYIGLFTWI